MANNFDSNITRPLARVFLEKFETNRIISRYVNTQLLQNKFNPSTGDTVDFKRPNDYVTVRTSTGDVTGSNPSDIITGKASGVVQNYFTAFVDFDEADEAIKMDQLDQLLEPLATRIVTDLELDFASYVMKNSGLLAGTYGTAVSTWDHVAEASSVLQSAGVPMNKKWCYAVNPYTQTSLASNQRSLGAGGSAGGLISEAHRNAILSDKFAGFTVLSATTLPSYSAFNSGGDRAGTLSANPDVTYLTHKDTMIQSMAVTGIGTFTGTIPAGTVVQITGRNRLNLSTRTAVVDGSGSNVEYTGVLTADASFTTGAGTIQVSGPAIYEATGAYNTVDSAPVSGDVITFLGADSTLYQPNLFWHMDAFSIGSVPMKKLYSTDTLMTTKDGLQMRVSKYADGDANKQTIRFDLRPAYAVLNPFFAGQGFGSA